MNKSEIYCYMEDENGGFICYSEHKNGFPNATLCMEGTKEKVEEYLNMEVSKDCISIQKNIKI